MILSSSILDSIVTHLDAVDFIQVILPLGLGCFALGLVFRLLFGKRSNLNRAVIAAVAIIVSYVIALFARGYLPELGVVVNGLPLITLEGTVVSINGFAGLDIQQLCDVLFPVVVLSFVANVAETMIPKGKNVFLWATGRILVVLISIFGYLLVMHLINTLVPAQWFPWVPEALLAILVLSFVLGSIKLVLGLALAAINPIIAACYAFFFGNQVGKSMSRSLLTTLVLVGLVLLMRYLGYTSLDLATIDPEIFAPGGIIMLVVWYVICRIL